MSVLITGGNGLIGSHVADTLVAKGERVTLFDLHYTANTARTDAAKTKGDVRNLADLKKAVKKHDAVFHFGAVSRVAWGQERPHECVLTNTGGTLNVLEAVRMENPEATIFFGSSREVYGEPLSLPVAETHVKNPISIYGVSKLSAENLCRSYARYFSLKAVVFRFSNVYGSRRDLPQRVIPTFVRAALAGKPLTVYGGGQVLDFNFIGDTIDGICRAYERRERIAGEDLHFVTGSGISVRELATEIKKLSGSKSELVVSEGKSFDVRRFVGDNTKARKLLGWKPVIGLAEGLQRTINAYASE